MQGQVTGGPREVLLKLWKSCACPSSLQGAQLPLPAALHPSVMLFIRSQHLQGCWGGDLGQPTLCSTLPRRFNSFQLAHEDGVLPSRSRIRTLGAYISAAAPPRSHSFNNSTSIIPKPPGITATVAPSCPKRKGQLLTVTVTTVAVTVAAVTIPLDTLQCLLLCFREFKFLLCSAFQPLR